MTRDIDNPYLKKKNVFWRGEPLRFNSRAKKSGFRVDSASLFFCTRFNRIRNINLVNA